jgi:hypothetical protein
MTTDGRHLILVRGVGGKSPPPSEYENAASPPPAPVQSYYEALFLDPLDGLALVRREVGTWLADAAALPKSALYCNGDVLVALQPARIDPAAPSRQVFTCCSAGLVRDAPPPCAEELDWEGAAQLEVTVRGIPPSPAPPRGMCYDPRNNCLFSIGQLAPNGECRVARWRNGAGCPPVLPPLPAAAVTVPASTDSATTAAAASTAAAGATTATAGAAATAAHAAATAAAITAAGVAATAATTAPTGAAAATPAVAPAATGTAAAATTAQLLLPAEINSPSPAVRGAALSSIDVSTLPAAAGALDAARVLCELERMGQYLGPPRSGEPVERYLASELSAYSVGYGKVSCVSDRKHAVHSTYCSAVLAVAVSYAARMIARSMYC